MGCNGDCYQGRWCDCKTEVDLENERASAYFFLGVLVILCGVVAWLFQ